MPEWIEKCWGRTRANIVRDVFQEHELEVVAGGFCSIHWHHARCNRFIVKSGTIGVVEFRAWTWERKFLTAGDEYDVPSQVTHRFEVYEDGLVFEEYWPDRNASTISTDDIRRITVGDKLDVEPTEQAFDEIIKQHIRASL